MRIDLATGWLEPVRRVASPNYDERPAGVAVDLLVVHGISLPPQDFGGGWIDALFTNTLDAQAHPYFAEICHRRVSSHVLIDRDGEITQYVPFHLRAWHAGESRFGDRPQCNDFSIGIELEGCDTMPYEKVQYETLADLVQLLMSTYPAITPQRIAGHCDIAPGRKTDPGPLFDWQYLHALLETQQTI